LPEKTACGNSRKSCGVYSDWLGMRTKEKAATRSATTGRKARPGVARADGLIGRHVLYLYGVSQSRPGDTTRQPGVDGLAPIEAVECDGMVCWISRVSAADFGENLARNMENLDWLAQASVAHQRAIAAINRDGEILPARFGTVFRNEESLREHIRQRVRRLRADFQRVKDAEEWGVKVFSVASSAPRAAIGSGKDYLKAKAAQLHRKTAADPDGELARFEQALSQIAVQTAAAGKISAGQRGLRFQTSLLVKKKDRKKLETLLHRFSQRWAETRQIECSGPWPPYSFVSRPADQVEQG